MSDENKVEHLKQIAKVIRYNTLIATTNAGSGHPTSAMSATELMAGLLFGGAFRYDLDQPGHPNNDWLIFSKGHAFPLFYSLWAGALRSAVAVWERLWLPTRWPERERV